MLRTTAAKRIIMEQLIDVPNHKLVHAICHYSNGMWGTLERYGIPHTKENHEFFVDIVQTKLMGSPDIEREWTIDEYENFVKFNSAKG